MKKFKVYFEIGGKKMKTDVSASNASEAKDKVKAKITFHKIEKVPNSDASIEAPKSFFGWW